MNKLKEQSEALLVSIWSQRFKESMVVKSPYTRRWNDYVDAYNGNYFNNEHLPDYKSNAVSNYVFSIVETIRPIMLDNDPKFLALPRTPDGSDFANDVQSALSYEWDRERLQTKLSSELINTLVIGNSVFFIPWDAREKEIKGIPVSAFNIFPDPLATSVEDAEYIIYASYKNEQILKRDYPEYADKLSGGSINHSELVYDNDRDSNISNQILVLEIYTRDYEFDEEVTEGLKKKKFKYPNGRIITMAPELGILLSDRANPYKDGEFPFVLLKNYDVPGKFWGEGEVTQLLNPQKNINDLSSAIVDNAKATANMPWIIDKNSGIGVGKITNRPGLVIRKNPGSEVRREVPPSMPAYIPSTIEALRRDTEEISGVFNSVKGTSSSGVYTAQGQLALMEAGQTRIRLKVKIMEQALAEMSLKWYSRMKQYWKEDRFISTTKSDGSYDLKMFKKDILKFDYDIKLSAGSTMPVNRSAMLDLMLRLAQTPMPDGQPLVDREAVAYYLPQEVRATLLKRMGDDNVILNELQQQIGQMQESMEEALTMVSQQIEEVARRSDEMDKDMMGIIEELTGAVEKINKEIGQLRGEYDKLEGEKREEDKLNQLRDKFYNEGYLDAERIMSGIDSQEMNYNMDMGMPSEILDGLSMLDDEALEDVIINNPEILGMLE